MAVATIAGSTFYVWFHRHARAHHHPGDCAHHLWPAQVAGTGQVPRSQLERIQEGLNRSAKHARAGNQDRGTERSGRKNRSAPTPSRRVLAPGPKHRPRKLFRAASTRHSSTCALKAPEAPKAPWLSFHSRRIETTSSGISPRRAGSRRSTITMRNPAKAG